MADSKKDLPRIAQRVYNNKGEGASTACTAQERPWPSAEFWFVDFGRAQLIDLGCGGKPQKNPKQKMAHSGVLDSQGSLVGGETFLQGEIFSMCSLLVLLRI